MAEGKKTIPYLVLVVLLIAVPPFLSSYWVGLLTQVAIFAILAMSLDILLGYTGLPSLGHAGIFGVAAYTIAVVTTTYHGGVWTSIVSAIIVGTLVSMVFGLLVSHVRDAYFLLIRLRLR